MSGAGVWGRKLLCVGKYFIDIGSIVVNMQYVTNFTQQQISLNKTIDASFP
jgi:dihydroxyacetone kinase DhaKLM complex PTS-EIIA-like component DhaM